MTHMSASKALYYTKEANIIMKCLLNRQCGFCKEAGGNILGNMTLKFNTMSQGCFSSLPSFLSFPLTLFF